ncbi:uncharacterized protein LOC112602507 [Melanaphis sacchari]|uniref:uncharacterized protein LOC112602507 n=1 Tax=Melanaphis sacchari TaxID=742174 RepID=UPI000DC13E8C|nr:uncharacterized protein LOC112602507 [Melanaphis sacchari]
MKYILVFLLVASTIFQIAQSADDQLQDNNVWTITVPTFSKSFLWIENFAKGATDEFMNMSHNMKDKLQNVFTVPSIPDTQMIDDSMTNVKIYTSKTITTPSQEIVTEVIKEEIIPSK